MPRWAFFVSFPTAAEPFRVTAMCAVLVAALAHAALAEENIEAEQKLQASFAQQVQSILTRHCGDCHSAEEPERHLTLTTVKGLLAGSETGPVLVPGKSKESLLMHVLGKESQPHMPPDGQMPDAEIAVLAKWIDALNPQEVVVAPRISEADRDHWAFQPIERPAVPQVENNAWVRTEVDSFILNRLEAEGLAPQAEADKATLLRRVYFDLIGLPPSPQQLEAFLSDTSPKAYERVVDELLASPRYGERWGRHWLDLARYADSSGFHNDFHRPNAWRYRDYVIESFNADKPYADFVREQIAGDELPGSTPETWIATAFGRNGPSNEDNKGKGLALEKYRADELDDIVATTSQVFLGLTIGCARCHDHKYDPLTQRDYYSLVSFFNNTSDQDLALAEFSATEPKLTPTKPAKKKDEILSVAMVLTDHGQKLKPARILWRGDVRNKGPVVQPDVPAVLSSAHPLESSQLENGQHWRSSLADWLADTNNPLTWRVMANRVWYHHFGAGLVTTPSNFGRLAEAPSHPDLLDYLADELRQSGGRLKPLHRLLVTSAVYRQSSSAAAATSDSLAAQSAPIIDPQNRLLWRMNKRRLEAEPLRDAILSVSGKLNLEMGGPGVFPRIRPDLLVASQRNKWPLVKEEGPQEWRRSVYVYVKRQLQLPMMELFDAPPSTHSCARRAESMVPTQALVLMNDEFAHDQARYFAERVTQVAGPATATQVQRALWIALGKSPSPERIATGVAFLEEEAKLLAAEGHSPAEAQALALADFCHVLINLSEFAYID